MEILGSLDVLLCPTAEISGDVTWKLNPSTPVDALEKILVKQSGPYQGRIVGRHIPEVCVRQIHHYARMDLHAEREQALTQPHARLPVSMDSR